MCGQVHKIVLFESFHPDVSAARLSPKEIFAHWSEMVETLYIVELSRRDEKQIYQIGLGLSFGN